MDTKAGPMRKSMIPQRKSDLTDMSVAVVLI